MQPVQNSKIEEYNQRAKDTGRELSKLSSQTCCTEQDKLQIIPSYLDPVKKMFEDFQGWVLPNLLMKGEK